ncbi:hypothetical protein EYF80_010832 [Liparis tanakae]|uniref:Uncharacterized protein n=1 Tax=Liparis tanakae TaxID=230148 RepID=A0A4Z2ILX8_9TELE|nr:hypothetical protein EYF80_010832 [Liparis tanakae]
MSTALRAVSNPLCFPLCDASNPACFPPFTSRENGSEEGSAMPGEEKEEGDERERGGNKEVEEKLCAHNYSEYERPTLKQEVYPEEKCPFRFWDTCQRQIQKCQRLLKTNLI